MTIITLNGVDHIIKTVIANDTIWFRGSDVAKILGYARPSEAIRYNVRLGNKRTLKDLKPIENLKFHERTSIYINEAGLRSLLTKSQQPHASEVAKQFGINSETRYIRKEIEIISFIQDVLSQSMIPFEFQKTVHKYRIDLYLPDQKLAIEIDEHNHKDRDAQYEHEREHFIMKKLGCKFMRINPDHQEFKLSTCIGQIMHNIIRLR